MERELKRLYLVRVKTTRISNKKLYIIADIDCSLWYLVDNDDKVQY